MPEQSPRANLQVTLLDALRDKVSAQQFQRWFRGLRVLVGDDGSLTLAAPNAFVSEWLESYYRTAIDEAVAEVAGPDLPVTISVDATPAPETRRSGKPRDKETIVVDHEVVRPQTRPSGARGSQARGSQARGSQARGSQARGSQAGGGAYTRGGGHRPQERRGPARQRKSTFAPRNSDLFGHSRYRNFLSDVILNDDYIFETFVEGPSNQLAHAAASAVSNNPGHAYNPLFLHGAVGLGKTHLLQAICTRYLQQNPEARVVYMSCESFVNQFIAAVAEGQIQDFRYRYRHVDLLLIDDIHFLAKKERTQEEFFHTFNTLYNSRKQIVLSCDSPPVEIPTLEDRLVSRFKWGLVAEIERPDHETRVSIVRNKAARRSLAMPDEVALYIADNVTANVRELEGAVLRVCSFASLSGKPVTLQLAQDSLRDLVRPTERKVSIETIMRVTSEHFAVKVSELIGKRRHKSISHPRQIAMYLARRLTEYSLVEVGGQFGGRDHTTVIYANDKIARELESNERLREDLESLVRRIRAGA